MKKTLLLLWLGGLAGPIFAQKIIDKTLPVAPGQLVNLDFRFADSIQVRYWDKAQVSVRVAITINGGRLNDALLVTTRSTADEVGVQTDFDQQLIKQGRSEDCPEHRYSRNVDRNGTHYAVCSAIHYQVYLPRRATLKLTTINGNIDIQGATEAVEAKTISGFIALNWPRVSGANIALKTITGEVYSDLAIEFTGQRPRHPIVGYALEGRVQGGGPTLRLESISNDIYLRQRK